MKLTARKTEHAPAILLRENRMTEGASCPDHRSSAPSYWEVRDLAVIGIFAALTKTTSLMVALMGGGMNPLTLLLKNLIFTAFLVVLLFKVRKPGTLLLFMAVNIIFAMLLMGGGFFLLPPMLAAGLLAEGVILVLGGYNKTRNIILGVALYDLVFKSGSLGISWLFVREQPQLLWITTAMVAIGYLGAVAGLFAGLRFVKELRHAGIVRN
ncbi:MptD family putative ECF transporter S component [Desulfotignum balticum]|jgi:energy-coupling factor transport system substrate-specific component|uniref:MptD family putative ECF transporter S component n=1 Tax=Desulfotignum balticum TaxID=115781 RepID=UPI000429590F|nr:MptD family putative ECF transporter S component [Desulfotignum balticum]